MVGLVLGERELTLPIRSCDSNWQHWSSNSNRFLAACWRLSEEEMGCDRARRLVLAQQARPRRGQYSRYGRGATRGAVVVVLEGKEAVERDARRQLGSGTVSAV